jgi:hypothetical protein
MVLDDVTFARLVKDRMVASVTITVTCGIYYDEDSIYDDFDFDGFSWSEVKAPPSVQVCLVGGGSDTLSLVGDAEARVTKLTAWLAENGLSGGKAKDAPTGSGGWVRTLTFTRADLPF